MLFHLISNPVGSLLALAFCMHRQNVEFGFPENFAFGGKSLQFGGEIYQLDGYFDLFLTKIAENM